MNLSYIHLLKLQVCVVSFISSYSYILFLMFALFSNFCYIFDFVYACVRVGEGNGNPLQCSCLENPRDGGAWWAASMGSHRVGHDWSDLAAAAAVSELVSGEWTDKSGTRRIKNTYITLTKINFFPRIYVQHRVLPQWHEILYVMPLFMRKGAEKWLNSKDIDLAFESKQCRLRTHTLNPYTINILLY